MFGRRTCLALLCFGLLIVTPLPATAVWSGDPFSNLPVCVAPNDQTDPALVSDGAGGMIVAWLDHRGGLRYHIYSQHVLADGTLDPAWPAGDLAVGSAANDQTAPVIASDGAGGAIVAWSAIPDGAPSGYDIYALHVLASGVVDPAWPAVGRVVCGAAHNQNSPAIVSDGAGGAIVTWQDARDEFNSDNLYAQHVLATGEVDATWPADGRALGDGTHHQFAPRLVGDEAGGAIVTWHEIQFGGNYDVYAQRVLASGIVDPAWPAAGLAVCTTAEHQVDPRLVSDGANGAIIAWSDLRGGIGANDIYAQHVLAGGALDAAWPADGLALCTAKNQQMAHVLVADGAGGALVAWEDRRDVQDIYAQHALASGTVDPAWPVDGLAVCGAVNGQSDAAIVSDGTGGAIVSWIDRRGNCLPELYSQHLHADGTLEAGWPVDGLPVSSSPGNKYQPTLVTDGARGAILVWDSPGSPTGYDVFAQVVRANGWLGDSAPPLQAVDAPVCAVAEYQMSPAIVPDGAGGAIIAWQDGRNAVDYDIYVQRVLADGDVDPAWPANGRALCAAADLQLSPVLVPDGAGGAIVAWADHRGVVDYDVYAQHILANGEIDPTWPADGSAVCTATGDQMECSIASDGAGGAIVAWQDFRTGNDQDIYAQHVRADGTVDPAWPADGRAVCTATNNQYAPKAVADDHAGTVIAWFDYRSGTADIYAMRVLADGTLDPPWPADGRALCTAANHQVYPAIVADGAAGAIVVWNDGRVPTNFYNDVYAQHVRSDGVVDPAWPVDGRALCTAGTKQGYPPAAIATDNSGGAFVAWADSRHGPASYADIYGQHVGADGTLDPAWPADGRGICTHGSSQSSPAIVSDGAVGAIVTWQDERAGCSSDIYALHVLAGAATDPDWPVDGRAVTRAKGSQYVPVAVADGTGGIIVAWEDERGVLGRDIYSQHLSGNGITDAQVSLVSAEADAEGVLVRWFMPQRGAAVQVYRHEASTGWSAAAAVDPDGNGLVSYLDRDVTAGRRYGYRVGITDAAGEQFYGETWITVPATAAAALAFESLQPNPADRDVDVSFTLPTSAPATVELIDLAGRVVAVHRAAAKPGRQMIRLGDGGVLPAGIYLVRLRQGALAAVRKLCVVH